MVLTVTIDDSKLQAKKSRLFARLPAIEKDILIGVGARLEAEMKRAIITGPLKAFDLGDYHSAVVFIQSGGEVRVGPIEGAPHGKYVALGTKKMTARPHHLKAIQIVLPEIPQIAQQVINKHTGDMK